MARTGPIRSFSVTLQPRKMGFARDLTLEDLYMVFSELKRNRTEFRATQVYVNAEGLPPIDTEVGLVQLASSPLQGARRVAYANPTHPSIGGGTRIEFSGGQVFGELRVRDHLPAAGARGEMIAGILGTLALMTAYLIHEIGGALLPLVAPFLLMILDGRRRIGNGTRARIEAQITALEPSVADAIRHEIQGISL